MSAVRRMVELEIRRTWIIGKLKEYEREAENMTNQDMMTIFLKSGYIPQKPRTYFLAGMEHGLRLAIGLLEKGKR